MLHILRLGLVAMVAAFGNIAWASGDTEPWRMADADQISSASYIILTVPIEDPSALAAIASEISERYDIALAAEWPLRSISVHCFVMDARGHSNIPDLVRRLQSDAQIRTAQPMQEFQTFSDPSPTGLYSDPLVPIQSALSDLNAAQAHRRSMGSGVRIGVVDSGIDGSHPELAAQLVLSKDFVNRADAGAAEAHGTAVAGVIGAIAGNMTGMVGVAPKAELVGLRSCWQMPDQPGRCSSFSLARSLNFAILNEIPVLNLSLGGPPDPLLEELVRIAIGRGIVIVAAAGETGQLKFPASVPGVIAAGGRTRDGIPAPAIDVISTAPGGTYRFVSGSSVAAAHVSGVVALLLSLRSDLAPQEIVEALKGAVKPGGDGTILDACVALQTVLKPDAFCSS